MPINLFQPVAVFSKDEENGGYFVFCPSVEGVFSQGETLEELEQNIKEAYHLMLAEDEISTHSSVQTKELQVEV